MMYGVHIAQLAWDPPSPAAAGLIRRAALLMRDAPEEVVAEVDAVTLAGLDPALLADPVLVDAFRRGSRANLLHWAEANVHRPGMPVAPREGPEVLELGRDLLRRGLDQKTLDAYRTGQNVAWRAWMATVFSLTSDPAELAEVLDCSARSIFAFVDATIARVTEQLERERAALTSGTHAERLEVVTLLLEGAPIGRQRAEQRLQYSLDRTHTAAIVFGDPSAPPDPGAFEHVAEALARAAGVPRPFSVLASAASTWVWVPGDPTPGLGAVGAALGGVRVALGTPARGVEGFRRSHLDALATQRLMHRTGVDVRLARFEEVEVVALATQDEERAQQLIERALGPLATAPEELRETLRVYLAEGSSASRTAARLPAHRNTVLNRLARAEDLLPGPVDGRRLEVALALEVARWLGTR